MENYNLLLEPYLKNLDDFRRQLEESETESSECMLNMMIDNTKRIISIIKVAYDIGYNDGLNNTIEDIEKYGK